MTGHWGMRPGAVGGFLRGRMLVCMLCSIALCACDGFKRDSKDPMRFRDYQLHVVEIDTAEAIQDEVERCLAYPTPPEFDWPQPMLRLLCQDNWHPITHFPQIKQMIDDRDWAGLERHYDDILRRHHAGEDPELVLYRSFPLTSWKDNSEGERYAAAWTAGAPDSAYAHLTHGKILLNQAWREYQSNSDEHPARKAVRAKKIATQALQLLRKASSLEPSLIPVYRERIGAAMLIGDPKELNRAFGESVEHSADNYYVRDRLMDAFEVSVFASAEHMQWLADEAEPRIRKNPRLRLLRARLAVVEGSRLLRKEWYGNALDHYREGLNSGPEPDLLLTAANIAYREKNYAQAMMYWTQALRFMRAEREVPLSGRASAWSHLDESGRAYCDRKSILTHTPREASAKKAVDEYETYYRRHNIDTRTMCGPGNKQAAKLRSMMGM